MNNLAICAARLTIKNVKLHTSEVEPGRYLVRCLSTVVGVSILLAVSVYQIILNEKLPTSSDDVPLIGTITVFYFYMSTLDLNV